MEIAAEAAGLGVDKARTITSSEWLRYQWIHVLAFPAEGTPSAFWSPGVHRSLSVKLSQKLTELLHYAKVNHALTRLFDSMGMGDNCLFFLKKP
jgi:hypothetical protein